MRFMNYRVEEDLERIRRANLPDDQRAKLEAEEEARRAAFKAEKPTAKDIFAMSVAVLSLLAPYVLTFFAIVAAVVFLILKVWLPG